MSCFSTLHTDSPEQFFNIHTRQPYLADFSAWKTGLQGQEMGSLISSLQVRVLRLCKTGGQIKYAIKMKTFNRKKNL